MSEVMITVCTKLTEIPTAVMWVYHPRIVLRGELNPVEQVVNAALVEHRAAARPARERVWVWKGEVRVPVEEVECP